MKGRSYGATRRVARVCALVMTALSFTAHADPFEASLLSGAPLESLVSGSGGPTLNTTQLVWGHSLTVNALSITTPGTVSVQLTDLGWPQNLDALSFLITDLHSIWQRLDDPGSLLFNVSGPTQLFAAVYARSASGGVGLYSLQVGFTNGPNAVPLPAAVWLLLSGLGAFGFVRRRG